MTYVTNSTRDIAKQGNRAEQEKGVAVTIINIFI